MIHTMAGVVGVTEKVCRAQRHIVVRRQHVATVEYSYGMTTGKLWMGVVVVHWVHGPEMLYISDRIISLHYKGLIERMTDSMHMALPYGATWNGNKAKYEIRDMPASVASRLLEAYMDLRQWTHEWRVAQDIDVDERKKDDGDSDHEVDCDCVPTGNVSC